MKAALADAVPHGDWRLELKFDGIRCIATVSGGRTQLWSRNRKPLTDRFPEIVEELTVLADESLVLDGELVVLDEAGRPSFQLLQQSALPDQDRPVYYYLFDVLHVGRRSLLNEPLEKRQQWLKKLLRRPPTHVRLSEVFDTSPDRLLAAAHRRGWEGIIAKKQGSLYEPDRRSGAWLKCKVRLEQEFVIGGFTPPRGSRQALGALLLGYHTDEGLAYAGKVGTGFSEDELTKLRKMLQPKKRSRSPFMGDPREKGASWVNPVFVCQIAFAEWTDDGRLRQPSYIGLRNDKAAADVVREKPGLHLAHDAAK